MFTSFLEVREATKVNYIAGLSSEFVDSICDILKHAAVELEIMHERQSGDLMLLVAGEAERRMYGFLNATNAELESLLGSVDYRTREKRTERTIICGTHAVDNRNNATESLSQLAPDELNCWIEAAIEAAPAQAGFDKKRKQQIRQHLAREAVIKRQKYEQRDARRAKWLKKMGEINVENDVDELPSMELKQLREQMQHWKSEVAIPGRYTGLAWEPLWCIR